MKNLVKWLLIGLIILSVCALLPAQTQSALRVNGKWIQNANGQNVVLRGVAIADLDAIYKGHRSQKVQTTINSIIDLATAPGWYTSVIRLTVHPTVKDETGTHGWLNYTPDTYFNTILDPAVKYVINKGRYVIIDWHYVGASWLDGTVANNTAAFWNYIAPKYANNPNVIFELFNEPNNAGNWSSWKNTANTWINSIRSVANNLIIVGAPMWTQQLPQSSGDLFTQSNIVYACHIYPQHGIPNWMDYASSVAPVMMTEWGFEKTQDTSNVVNGTYSSWGQRYHDFINGKGNVGWTAWCFDFVYRSVMFDANWTLLGNGQTSRATHFFDSQAGLGFNETTAADTNDNYMGAFAKSWLAEFPTTYPSVAPTPTPTPAGKKGDANGDGTVNINDALVIAQRSAGMSPNPFNTTLADANCDNVVNINDALIVARYSAGLAAAPVCP